MSTAYIDSRDIRNGHVTPFHEGMVVHNNTGSEIAAGKLVAVSGFDTATNNPRIVLADPTNVALLADYVTTKAIPNGSTGRVFRGAVLRDLNTSSYSAVGDPVYSTTSGGITHTAPTSPDSDRQVVGWVDVKDASAGVVYIDLRSNGVTAWSQKRAPDTAIRYAEVSLTNAEVLALRAAPKTLVAAPGAGYVNDFLGIALFFDYAGAYTETADNLAVRWGDGSGTQVSETIEMTGFIDATADTLTRAGPAATYSAAKTAADNKALVLHNIGDGEFGGGNAANVIRARVAYRIIPAGW